MQEVLALGGKLAVEVGGSDLEGLVLGKAAGGVLDDGKHLGQHLVELVLDTVEHLLLELVDFVPQGLALLVVEGLDLALDAGNLVALWLHILCYRLAYFLCALTQLVVRQLGNLGIDSLDFVERGLQFLHVALALAAEYRL